MTGWLDRNIDEIRQDRALQLYGAFLALTHVLTGLYWWQGNRLGLVLTSAEVICWPFWLECGAARALVPPATVILCVYLSAALVSAFLFLRPAFAARAWLVLAVLTLLKLGLVLLDFRLRQNQHTMAGLASLAFLVLPGKRITLKLLVCFFYLWAGLLKLSPEWLSGAALYNPVWFFTGRLLPLACTYVVVLETLLVWGTLSDRRWLFHASLGQLGLFHLFSWPVVGFFYPTLMACLLAIFLLDRHLAAPPRAPAAGVPSWCFLGMVSLFQLVPWFLPGDSRLTGEGRIFTLHMFDALTRCEAKAMLKKQNVVVEKRLLYRPLAIRIHCDPLVHFQRARALCRSPERGALFDDLDLLLDTQLSTAGSKPTRVIGVMGFCSRDLDYRVLWHNDWIETGEH